MGLVSVLEESDSIFGRIRCKAPEPLGMRRTSAQIEGAGEGREIENIPELQARIAAASDAHGLGGLSSRDLRDICRVFLSPPSPPGRESTLGDRIVREVDVRARRSPFLALIGSYISSFRSGDDDISRLGAALQLLAHHWRWRTKDPWPERISRFDLFDAEAAPARISQVALSTDASIRKVLEGAGLNTDGRRRGGLSEAAFAVACAHVSKLAGHQAMPLQRRLVDWASDGGQNLVFVRAWPDLVRATLLPWKGVEPAGPDKVWLTDTLLRFGGGDPRTSPARWRPVEAVASDALDVLMRWLTRASVIQFLDIVDRSLREPDARRMWAYRRSFWTSYLLGEGDGAFIERAWVAFGAEGARLARDAARSSSDPSLGAYGKQTEKSSQHSALIMQIGDLLIVDWSHSGKYNVWRRGDSGRPTLFQGSYSYGLDGAPFRDSHVGAANYTWQKRLASIIEGRNFYSEKPSWRPRRV